MTRPDAVAQHAEITERMQQHHRSMRHRTWALGAVILFSAAVWICVAVSGVILVRGLP